MGLDDIKNDLMDKAHDMKSRLVEEFDELTDRDLDEAGDDPDQIVATIQEKTGESREAVEARVRQTVQH